MAQPTSTRTHTHTNTLTLSDTNTHTNAEKKRLTSARSLGSKLSGIHPVVEVPLLCFAATPTRHQCHAHAQSYQAAIHLPQRQPSVYRVVYWQPWHLAAGHATACPVHKTKHGCCALLFSCPCAVVATWGQLLPCSRMLYISFVSLSAVSAVSVAVFAVLFTISNRMYVLPYPVSRIPYPAMPYAVSRFLIYAIPCMCHISAAKHAAHACGAWQQQKYHKKCHKRST